MEFAASRRPLEEGQSHVAGDAATPQWDGSRLDRHFAVWGLAQHLRSERPA